MRMWCDPTRSRGMSRLNLKTQVTGITMSSSSPQSSSTASSSSSSVVAWVITRKSPHTIFHSDPSFWMVNDALKVTAPWVSGSLVTWRKRYVFTNLYRRLQLCILVPASFLGKLAYGFRLERVLCIICTEKWVVKRLGWLTLFSNLTVVVRFRESLGRCYGREWSIVSSQFFTFFLSVLTTYVSM
jgi:hypothetical protein